MKISSNINDDIEFVLIDQNKLQARIKELAEIITRDYQDRNPVFICLLKGSLHFMTSLTEKISIPLQYDCLKTSSYANTVSTGKVSVTYSMLRSVKGRHVILVEDIIDTGYTMKEILRLLKEDEPASIEIITMLNKNARREVENINPKYIGFEVPDYFVVGFGLDYNEYYRNLPYIGVLKESVYKENGK